MADQSNQPIIIKKVNKVEGGHHGGAWKVAYADFVTAMMAFFLLLWLLNVTTSDQKKGIADYFAPASISSSKSGAGGLLGGQTVIVDGARISTAGLVSAQPGMAPPDSDAKKSEIQKDGQETGSGLAGETGEASGQVGDTGDQTGRARQLTDQELEAQAALREEQKMREIESQLKQAIQDNPQIAELSKQIITDLTPEGLRIQLVDQDQSSMFNSGSAGMNDRTRKLMQLVAQALAKLPNKISISGHTDATPFRGTGGYGNWELSADRANASRRALIEAGLAPPRIKQVVGKAETEPLISSDPQNPANRRISVVVLRERGGAAAQ